MAHGEAVEAVSMAQYQGPLPPELWTAVLARTDHRSLKNARRVNTTFRDLATPFLFDHIVYSVDEKNIRNLRLLSKSNLSKHVQFMYLDTTSYRQAIDTRRYAQLTSGYFGAAFSLGLQKSGPLSESALLKLLRSDPAEDLGLKFLSGVARKAYVTGYTTYVARSDHHRELMRDDGIYKTLKDLLPKFKHIKHLESTSVWSTYDDSVARFEHYLRKTLPEKTLSLIPGLNKAVALSADGPAATSTYSAPGQTARRLNPLVPPPNFSGCWGETGVFDLLNGVLRAFNECNPKLGSLSLPGNDQLRSPMAPRDRIGIIPAPALLTVLRTTCQAPKKSLLLPLFQGLKSLELKLDFAHPGTSQTHRYHMDPSRLCTALQKMRDIEKLSLGAVEYVEVSHNESWSLYETLLIHEDDDKDIIPRWDAEHFNLDDGDDLPDMGNMPPGVQGIMNLAMLAASLGIPPPGPNSGPAHPPAPATTPAGSSSPGPATPAASSAAAPSSAPTTQTDPPENPKPKIHPSAALKPNPWPKLKHLSLFNMSATKEDLARLTLTIALTVRHLELYSIYIEPSPPSYGTSPDGLSDDGVPYEHLAQDWLDTLDLMGGTLSLDKATMFLNERDTEALWELLAETIDGFADAYLEIDDLMEEYLVDEEARGAGFASFVIGVVKDQRQYEQDHGEGREEWSDEDSSEELPDLI